MLISLTLTSTVDASPLPFPFDVESTLDDGDSATATFDTENLSDAHWRRLEESIKDGVFTYTVEGFAGAGVGLNGSNLRQLLELQTRPDVKIPVGISDVIATLGTWTPTVAKIANTICLVRSASAAAHTLIIPISKLLTRDQAGAGFLVESVDLWYVLDAAVDVVTATFYKTALNANASAPTGSAPAFSYDAAHDAAGERITAAAHKMTLTLTTPVWVDKNERFDLALLIDGEAGAAAVLDFYGAQINGRAAL